MNVSLDLDSFSLSEFCLHQLDILLKHSRISEQSERIIWITSTDINLNIISVRMKTNIRKCVNNSKKRGNVNQTYFLRLDCNFQYSSYNNLI